MSCFNLQVPPPKKAWKTFKSKLQSKLHKLNRSKAIKKPKTQLPATNPSPFIEQRIQRKKNLPSISRQGIRSRSHRRYLFKKKAAPVYIDRLFKEPIAAELFVKYPRPYPSTKDVKLLHQVEGRASGSGTGTSSKEEKASGGAADDMWESLALASPQMNGIDQRAEEFIKRFRAEMQFQEMMARRL
ncbi:hypothetical protein Patl1_01778 [Pistacia atlantica]|uniref:Uncharacterized protein n=1 Tax=Pistacia atlantica TaxID=434234 RepID=A0ACC1C795_9ROSI|nr:hypothetical protein Patl1_01778 [Pistacia atlantica]